MRGDPWNTTSVHPTNLKQLFFSTFITSLCIHFIYFQFLCECFCTLTSLNQLTWHDGAISESEVWVKLCGDKREGSVKLNYQIFNVPHPNSVNNTCVFTAFAASDSVMHLHVALDRYKDQQKTQWRLELGR